MRRPSNRTPWPWHLTLSHPQIGTARLLLATDQSGALVTRHRHLGLENVVPTDFAYGSQSPFTRRTALFKRLVMGMGQPVEISESSQRYSYSLGMDWACGLGALATSWTAPFTIGTGPIKSIEQLTIGGTRYLCVLSGNQVWTASPGVGAITGIGSFTLRRDFGPPSAPPAPTAVVTLPAARNLRYLLVTQGAGGPPLNYGPPTSAAGGILNLATGPTANPPGSVALSWPPLTAGSNVIVYRSEDGGATWKPRTAAIDATSLLDDNDASWGAPVVTASLPTVAAGQVPLHLLAAAPQGRARLWVGMESGGFWAWDGTAWQQNTRDGRALAMEGSSFYFSNNLTGAGALTTPPMNFVYRADLEPMTGTPPSVTLATSVYADEHPSDITRLLRLNGALLVFSENRISVGSNTTITDLTPDRGLPSSSNNGRSACVWLGSIYAPYGMGLYKITPTGAQSASIEPVGLERLIENSAPVQGRITALAPWGPWHLFWAAYNEREGVGGTAYVGKYGAWVNPEAVRDPNSQLIPVLHGALESWPGRQITWMQHSTIGEPSGNGRMYAGFDNGGLAWTILPGQTPFAPNDPFCTFRSTGFTVLSRHSMGFQADDKTYFDLTAFGPTVTNGQRVRFSYQLPDDTTWRDIPGEVTEGGEPLVFPEGAQGKWIQLMVTMETDVPGDSPVIEGLALGEQLRPSSIEEISFTAHVGPRLIRRDGHVTRASAKELHDLLRRLEAKGDDVTVLLPDGETQRAAINDFTDRYLEGSTTRGPRHDMSLTLLTFRTAS